MRETTPTFKKDPDKEFFKRSDQAVRALGEGDYPRAREFYTWCHEEALRLWGPDKDLTIITEAQLALAHRDRPETCIEKLAALIPRLEEKFGVTGQTTHSMKMNLIVLYSETDNHGAALALAQKTLAESERAFGPDDSWCTELRVIVDYERSATTSELA